MKAGFYMAIKREMLGRSKKAKKVNFTKKDVSNCSYIFLHVKNNHKKSIDAYNNPNFSYIKLVAYCTPRMVKNMHKNV